MNRVLRNLDNVVKYSCRLYNVADAKTLTTLKKPPWKVLFFGSDEFSLHSLRALLNEYEKETVFSNVEVVTCSQINPVWRFSTKHKLEVRKWPTELKKCEFDLGVVVSFGYLIPEEIINAFPMGMLNVHASLLPRWRGASPIVYAIANGDKETGVTVMRVRPKKFDLGEILYQKKVPIPPDIEMPELHEQLGKLGADSLIDTIKNIDERLAQCRPQLEEGASYAPKITPAFAQIKWNTSSARDIYNLQRALKSVLPLKTMWDSVSVKLLNITICEGSRQCNRPGFVEYSKNDKVLIVECANSSWISVKNVGVQGKKVMGAPDFYNGFISKLPKNKISCFT